MSPINEFVNLKQTFAPQSVERFNLYTAINVNAQVSDGYSSGEALNALNEVAKTSLPQGYSFDYSGLTRAEQESSNSTFMIFGLCLLFVYLILSAQYESYLLPLSVSCLYLSVLQELSCSHFSSRTITISTCKLR